MKNILFFFIALLVIIPISAQESIVVSGGDATGPGGSSSYSVGQLLYTTNVGATGSVAQGVQQIFCTNPDVPTITATPSTICPGASTILDWSGAALNDATNWHIYTTACGVDQLTSQLETSLNVSPAVTTTYFIRGEDGAGCVDESTIPCGFITIIVEDNEDPVITCPEDISVNNDTGLCSAGVTFTTPFGTDNCTGSTTVQTDGLASGSVFPVGTTTNTFLVTDASGNKATCSFDVTVNDTEDPTAICQDITVDLDATGNATITADDVDNGSSDPCGIDTMVLSQYDFDCSHEGENTVTLTVTDIYGNTATCTATVTVNAIIPEVEITQSELPDFCQGEYVLLTATSNQEVTYSWNGGETTDIIEVSADGTYGVTVTSTTACTAYEEYVVIGFDTEATISSYVLLATDEIELKKNTSVLSGGVGVIDSDGKVKLKSDSHVNGFVRASEIDIDNSSSAGSSALSPANVVLPPFIYNTMSNKNSPDIIVLENQLMTLYGTVYGKIDIKDGASVIFAESNVFINELKTKKNTTIEFSGCSFLYINKKLKFDDNSTLNALGNKVVIYVDDKIEVKKGGSITASMHANDHDIKVKGKNSDPTNMKGMFIAKKIKGDDYVNWELDPNCDSCPNALQNGSGSLLDLANNDNQYWTISLYPNPAKEYVILENPNGLPLNKADIFDLNGRLVQTVDLRSIGTESMIDISLLQTAVYFVIIKGEFGQLVKQLMKE